MNVINTFVKFTPVDGSLLEIKAVETPAIIFTCN
jgi:hypothetical protein